MIGDPNSPGFAFDHDQLHRTMAAAQGSSVATINYLLDPLTDVSVPSGWWNSTHAQAHSDFATAFPGIYWPSQIAINDINLAQGPTQWWQFSNWQAHNLANQALTPSA